MKLFGGSKGSRTRKHRSAAESDAPKRKKWPKALAIVLAVVLVLEGLYFFCIYSKHPFIDKWRSAYITTAMDTLSHQWLATAFIPPDVIQEVLDRRNESLSAQDKLESSWTKPQEPEKPEEPKEPEVQEIETNVSTLPDDKHKDEMSKDAFFELFHELDQTTFEAYLDKHPSVLDNGWENIVINEAGLKQKGTDIMTIQGEQVLAIDVPNQILLLRVEGSGYRGILAVAKDPARLSLQESAWLGTNGQTVAEIATRTKGELAMTGSGFNDPDGNGSGGVLAGFAMCDSEPFGRHSTVAGYKRLELHEDNLMYIYDPSSPVAEDCTDAVEWVPAMIIDGKDVIPYGYDGIQPRACIGQSDKYEVLMLIIEGRLYFQGIIGTTLYECADILLRHGCMQAMNLDGGTSAILWYNGETITQCSNTDLKDGRLLPSAFVYGAD